MLSRHLAFRNHLAAGQAGGVGGVQIGLEEERGGGAERAIGEAFEAADVEHVAAEAGQQADGGQALPGGQRLVAGDAHGEFAAPQQVLVDAQDVGRGGHILHAGDAVFGGIAHGGAQGVDDLFRRRARG